MMGAILTRQILNSITNVLYAGAKVAFYSLSPTLGEVLIATLTDGFTFTRARQSIEDGSVKLWLAQDVALTLAQIKTSSVVELTANGITTRYAVTSLLSQQQLGAGFVLRLAPQKGAAG
jgi:hypothetical protein